MSKINIRESLNRLDLQTDNKYDLLNTFNSKKLSDNSKKKLAEAIENNSMASVNRILHESEEQLYKVVISSGATKRNFESALYEDEAEEIVDYYGGRWIDENGFEWDMYVEEDDDSTEHAIVDNSYDMEDDDERAQREYVESLNEAINAKDSMVAQEFNYTMQYGDQSSDVSAAVIIIPGGLMINGESADLTVYAEDENGEVINFKSVEEANDWINKYKDNVEFHVEQGNELHATPSAYYNSFDESLTEAIKDVNSLHSKIWNMDNNEKICFPNGYCVKCEFYDREGKAKRYIVTNKKDNVIIRGEFGFAWQPQIKKFEKDFFNLLNGRSVDESLKEAKIIEPKYRDGDVVFVGDASGYHGTFLIKGDFRNIPEELYHNIRQITKYGNLDKPYYKVEYRIDSDHLFEEDYRKFFEYITPILEDAGIDILKSEKDISNESLTEANYGGAYDIENDMFFTKEDIVEFAEEVCEYLGDIFGYQYDINNVYMDGPRKLYINIYDNNYIEVESTFDIDMRKIRKPSDLSKVYGLTIENWFQKSFAREYRDAGLDESLVENRKVGSNKISAGMGLPGKDWELVKITDGVVSSKDKYECRIYSKELDTNYKKYGFYQGEVVFSEDYDPQLIDSVFPDEGTKVKLAIYRVPEDDPDHDWTGDYFVDYIDETNESLSEDYEDDVDNWQYLDTDQDYKKKKDYFGDIETVDEQLYKIVCKSGASEWPFESALSYEDAQEIVEYYGGRWIDERGFEWSMEIEEDDESTERVHPFAESLNEKLIPAPQEVVDELLDILNKFDFVLDDSLPHPIGKTWSGNTHVQVINKDSKTEETDDPDIYFEQLKQYIPNEMENEIDSLSEREKVRITYNFGINRNWQVTGGLDVWEKHVPGLQDESLKEQVSFPGYAVKYTSGYAGNGVNSSKTEWFRTKEERDRRVKELEDKNYIEIKTWKMDNFYHTLPKEESLTEGIEDLYSISSTKAKDMTDEDFKVLKPLVDEYFKERKALGTWPDSIDERNFVKKWYKLADKCKEIAKNGMQGITGYGRLNDFIKIKILELARSVDNTFPWYVRNQLEKFGELDESLKEDIEDEEDFEYDDSDEVEEGVYFFADGENYAWVERIAGPVHLDFDNWAVWSAREIVPIQDFIIRKNEQGGYDVDKDAYIAAINSKPIVYFVVDEDTGFIDWGPVENQTEAQDFLNGKISDWEEETGFRHPMHNDFFDESLKESRAIKNDDDFEITLHYDDIGNGKEYDYKLGYDEVVAYLKEIAWSNGDGPEDASEDEYLEWVMDNFDELSKKYELNVLDYFEDEASQYEYDHRNDEP